MTLTGCKPFLLASRMAAARRWEPIMDVDVEMVLLHGILLHDDVVLAIMGENEVDSGCLTMGMENTNGIVIVLKWDNSDGDVVGKRRIDGVLFAEKRNNEAGEILMLRDNNVPDDGVQRRTEDDSVEIDVLHKGNEWGCDTGKRNNEDWVVDVLINFGKTSLAGNRNKEATDAVEYREDNEDTNTGGHAGDDEAQVPAELLGSNEARDIAVWSKTIESEEGENDTGSLSILKSNPGSFCVKDDDLFIWREHLTRFWFHKYNLQCCIKLSAVMYDNWSLMHFRPAFTCSVIWEFK